MKYFPTICLWLSCLLTFSQQVDTVHKLTVYYNVNSDEISWNAEHAMDSVIKKLLLQRASYSIQVTGYSDSVGSAQRNLRLSESRAKKIADYFERNLFPKENITSNGIGYKPNRKETTNERKVKIAILSRYKLNPQFDSRNYEEFTIDGESGYHLSSKSGTSIFISPETFADTSGELITGPIKLFYREYRDTFQFLKSGISMFNEKRRISFPSTGLFELHAYRGKTKVEIDSGKNVTILFGLNRRGSMLDLYFKDDTTTNWVFTQHITDEDGKVSLHRHGFTCGTRSYYCFSNDECLRMLHLIDEGSRFAGSKDSLLGEIKNLKEEQSGIMNALYSKRDSLNKIITRIYNSLRAVGYRHFITDTLFYKIERIKVGKTKTVFHVRSDAKGLNEMRELSGMNFKLRGLIPDSVYKHEWDHCRITGGDGKFSMQLMLRGKKLKLQNLKIIEDKVIKPAASTGESFSNYIKTLKEREKAARLIQDTVNMVRSMLEAQKELQNKLNKEIIAQADSFSKQNHIDFHCFWTRNRDYMADAEKALTMEQWITYFDNNKSLMRRRYETLKKKFSKKYSDCKMFSRIRDSILGIQQYYENVRAVALKDTTQPKRDTVVVSLNILKTGVYNTAYPMESATPLAVKSYIYNSDTIDIVRIRLVAKNFNGAYASNVNGVFGPYMIPRLHNYFRIIAFDKAGNAYASEPLFIQMQEKEMKSVTLKKLDRPENIMPLFPLLPRELER